MPTLSSVFGRGSTSLQLLHARNTQIALDDDDDDDDDDISGSNGEYWPQCA